MNHELFEELIRWGLAAAAAIVTAMAGAISFIYMRREGDIDKRIKAIEDHLKVCEEDRANMLERIMHLEEARGA